MVTDLILTYGTHWFPFENGIIKTFTLFSFHLYSAILIKCLESICNNYIENTSSHSQFLLVLGLLGFTFWFLASCGKVGIPDVHLWELWSQVITSEAA